MVTDGNAGNPNADRLDDARSLVTEHGRTACLGCAVDRVEVRVTDSACSQAYEDFRRRRRSKVERNHLERAARVLENRGTNFHGVVIAGLGDD